MKLLLIYPSQLYSPNWGQAHAVKPHLVLLFSYLRHHGIQAEVVDLENELGRPGTKKEVDIFRKTMKDLLSRRSFDIAAISCYTSLNYLSSILAAEACKENHPYCRVVVGGYHPSVIPQDFIYKNSPFDFIVKGEGESSLLKICRNYYKRNNEPKIIQGEPLDLRSDFSIRHKEYPYVNTRRYSQIYLSRGCSFNCAFCAESRKGTGVWRSFSVEKAVKEIKNIIFANNPLLIGICDACFGSNKTWRREFLKRLIEEKIDKIFVAETRIDLLEEEDVDLFSELNFHIILGIESCSQTMLKIMKKTTKPRGYLEKIERILEYMNKKQVTHQLNLIFNHPGETPVIYRETISFLNAFFKKQDVIFGIISAQNYAFFPGSNIYENLAHYKNRYGTVIYFPQWWKRRKDIDLAARFIKASKISFKKNAGRKYWKKDVTHLNRDSYKKMPLSSKFFWQKLPY